MNIISRLRKENRELKVKVTKMNKIHKYEGDYESNYLANDEYMNTYANAFIDM